MKGYYDKIVPTQLSKLLKKLDPEAKIEAHNLDTRSPADKKMGLPEGQSINTVRAQSIRITPKMRESIKRGLPTYADGGAVDDEDEGLTAYHGSPYDFEQFDTSKIGTGHGTQAYGHGLYLAESEPIAKGYADAAEDKYSPNSIAVRMLKGWGSHETAIQKQKEHIQKLEGSHNEDFIAPYRGALQILESGTTPKVGHMYEVRIKAHPDHFLDWNAPLNEQSEYVKNAFSERAGLFEPGTSYDGKGLYRIFEDMHGDDSARASQELAKAGIKGIKYFAHALSEGSQNYVVFNHDHVQVKRKYAQGGAIDET
jgi:hypothetical protein